MQSRYLNAVLTAIAVLLAGNLWVSLQATGVTTATPAFADEPRGIPNAGAQRVEMINKLDRLADAVDSVADQLNDGLEVNVGNFPDSD